MPWAVRLALFGILFASAAAAQQQQIDPATLQRIIVSLQQQRNEAMDKAALAEARAAQLAEALRQAQDEAQKLKAELAKGKESPSSSP